MSLTDNRLLYHYTDSIGLLGMLENTTPGNLFITMRATFYRFLNDPSEYQYGVDIVNKHLSAIEDELNVESRNRLDIIKKVSDKTQITELSEIALNSNLDFKMVSQYYISFTIRKDNLPFWGMYAKNGSGICIEFDTNKIQDQNQNIYEVLYINKQKQNEDDLKELITKFYIHFSEMYESTIERNIEPKTKLEFFGTAMRRMTILYFLYDAICSVVKKDSYEHEREFRMKVQDFEKFHFRTSNGLIVPFVEKKIPLNAISEIMVGPTLDFERSKLAIQMTLMSKLGMDYLSKINITKSEIAYRG